MNPQVSKGNLTWFQDVRTCVHSGFLRECSIGGARGSVVASLLAGVWYQIVCAILGRSWLSDALMDFLAGGLYYVQSCKVYRAYIV